MTVGGAGLLVGTALAVIIPEGVHTLYDAQSLHGQFTHIKIIVFKDTNFTQPHVMTDHTYIFCQILSLTFYLLLSSSCMLPVSTCI